MCHKNRDNNTIFRSQIYSPTPTKPPLISHCVPLTATKIRTGSQRKPLLFGIIHPTSSIGLVFVFPSFAQRKRKNITKSTKEIFQPVSQKLNNNNKKMEMEIYTSIGRDTGNLTEMTHTEKNKGTGNRRINSIV